MPLRGSPARGAHRKCETGNESIDRGHRVFPANSTEIDLRRGHDPRLCGKVDPHTDHNYIRTRLFRISRLRVLEGSSGPQVGTKFHAAL